MKFSVSVNASYVVSNKELLMNNNDFLNSVSATGQTYCETMYSESNVLVYWWILAFKVQ